MLICQECDKDGGAVFLVLTFIEYENTAPPINNCCHYTKCNRRLRIPLKRYARLLIKYVNWPLQLHVGMQFYYIVNIIYRWWIDLCVYICHTYLYINISILKTSDSQGSAIFWLFANQWLSDCFTVTAHLEVIWDLQQDLVFCGLSILCLNCLCNLDWYLTQNQ